MSHSHESAALINEPLAVGVAGTEGKTLGNLDAEDDSTRQLRKNPQMTAVGKENLLKMLKHQRKSISKRLDRQISILNPLLDPTSINISAVNIETVNLDRIYHELTETHARICEALTADEDADEFQASGVIMDEIDSRYFDMKTRTGEWQSLAELAAKEADAVSNPSSRASSKGSGRSGKSKSSRASSKSSRASSHDSKCSNKSLELKAKIAGLKAESEAMKKTSEAQLAAQLLKKEQEIAKMEAMEKVYAESTYSQGVSTTKGRTNTKPEIKEETETTKEKRSQRVLELDENINEPPLKKSRQPDTKADQADLQSAVVEMIKLQTAPKPDLDTFRGDPLDYPYFKASFKEVVENAVQDQRGRLTRLIKYTAGDAKDLIKHLVHAENESCYDEAIRMLDLEYGNPHLIHRSYIKELRQWEPIKSNDTAAYKKLYRFLLKCQTYKSSYRLTELDSTDILQTVIRKAPSLQERWNRKAVNIRRTSPPREPDFADLLKFIEYEVALLSDPSYSKDALLDNKQLKTNFVAIENGNPPAHGDQCSMCSGSHDIEKCESFIALGIDERHKSVFRLKLCFSCLGPVSHDHNGKNCLNKRKCLVCQENHPTALHGGKGLSVNLTNVPSMSISMCVVQVQVWHQDNPDVKQTVYALLDECSNGTFIKDDLLQVLDVPAKDRGPVIPVDVNTLVGVNQQSSGGVSGLIVQAVGHHASIYKDTETKLPYANSCPSLAVGPEEIPTPNRIRPWKYLDRLTTIIPDYDPAIPIALLIGGNCPKANEVAEVIPSVDDGPYAKRTRLGWCVIGPISTYSEPQALHSYYTSMRGGIPVKDVVTNKIVNHTFVNTEEPSRDVYKELLHQMYQQDFNEPHGEKEGLSVEDRRFLKIMEENVTEKDGHYQLPLPIRNHNIQLPNNRIQALHRLESVKRKLLADSDLRTKYIEIMSKMIASGYARRADTRKDKPGKVWTVPHFAVCNQKSRKLRVVFDFSAKFKGRCLNDELIQGPNLANLMIGVIIRFRKEEIAYMADIEAMYHQVKVPEDQRSLLRFLFWPDGDLNAEPVDHEMCVHAFGAISSGSCANYALKKTADEGEKVFGPEAANAIHRNFYVDDHLKSAENVKKAKELFLATREMCAAKGFNLTKFVSNSSELAALVPSECLASTLVDLNMSKQPIPLERALGVFWCIEDDTLQFRITLQDKPMTRRGVLATIGSVHDPTGVAGPFLLPGRRVLQMITKQKGDWDDPLTPELKSAWEKWRSELHHLEQIKIQRCYKTSGFETVSASLHSFSDACDYGYGMVTYLRQVNKEGDVCASFVMAKSRVVPSKQTTVPRMELTAAVVSAEVTALVKGELDMTLSSESYWVDSTIALGYIQNETKRPRTYVANRQNNILRLTLKDSWNHIDTKLNPADYASRGLVVSEEDKVKVWLNGPDMLWTKEDPSDRPRLHVSIPDDDPEIQQSLTCNVVVVAETNSVLCYLEMFSSWTEMKVTLATATIFMKTLQNERENPELTVDDLAQAENQILRIMQDKHFRKEKECLKLNNKIMRSSSILKLDPFLDDNQILRVGGRLRRGCLPNQVKHPIILPKREPIVERIIAHHHEEVAHLGRSTTLNEVRSKGYWIINGGSQVRCLIEKCRRCKELRGLPETQKMADLPEKRIACSEPPFTYCGADMFGPFLVKEGRKELKRYGLIFTCYSCRGVHIETTTSLDTDSFILALRRFLSRRGPVRSIRSDNGGNFVGVEEEMKKAVQEMDQDRIRTFLLEQSCDWIEWEKNPPESSHMGGVWERQIRTVRNVLSSLLKDTPARVDDETLRTLFVEVEAIVNSRPLAVDNLNDETADPLTPNHLLTMKSKVLLPPPGAFERADLYCRKRWRKVQHLANEFWQRFSKEYIRVSQIRQKWNTVRRNVAVNDIVLVLEKDLPRNRWSKGRIVEVFPGEDGLVRHASVKTGPNTVLKRPITKLVVIAAADASED